MPRHRRRLLRGDRAAVARLRLRDGRRVQARASGRAARGDGHRDVRGRGSRPATVLPQTLSRINRRLAGAVSARASRRSYARFCRLTDSSSHTNGGHNPPVLIGGDAIAAADDGRADRRRLCRTRGSRKRRCSCDDRDMLVMFTGRRDRSAQRRLSEEFGDQRLLRSPHAGAGAGPISSSRVFAAVQRLLPARGADRRHHAARHQVSRVGPMRRRGTLRDQRLRD